MKRAWQDRLARAGLAPVAFGARRVAFAAATLGIAALVGARPAHAQDEALDADPRPYDKVWASDSDTPYEGTITSGPEADPVKLKKKGDTISLEIPRSKITRILPRQTAPEAFKDRADRIKAGSADDHHKLGDWAWRSTLELEALAEMRKAVAAAPQGAASVPHRARLARLLLWRRSHVEQALRDDLDEELETLWQKTEKADARSPEVELGRARALLAQGLAPLALASLEKARAELGKLATDASNAPTPDATPSPKGDDPKALPTPAPKPSKSPKRGDRDGENVHKEGDPAQPDAPPPADPQAPPEDKSADKWPGLSPERRETYRDVLLAQAEGLLQAGRAGEVAAGLGALFEAFPQHRQAIALSAEAKLLIGDPKGAIEDFNRVIAVSPKDAPLIRDRGIAFYAAGQLDEAKADLEKAIELGLDDARPAKAHLGLVHLRAGRFKAAAAALEEANKPEEYGPAKLGLALLAELQGKAADAAALADAARTLSSELGLVDYEVATAKLRAQEADAARTLLRQAILEGLPFPLGCRWLAEVSRARGDPKEELRVLEELVGSQATPAADDFYALGRAYVALDRLEDGRTQFDRALAVDPKHVPSLLGAGSVLYRLDDREGARGFFQQAAAIDKANVYAQRALKNLEDARTRRVWIDRFDRETADVENGWVTEQSLGVQIGLKDHKASFTGKQEREDLGKTRLFRDVLGQQAVRLEVKLDLSQVGDARCGIRFETDKGSMILFRDQDGSLQESYSKSGGIGSAIYENPEPVGAWPKDGHSHVLAVEVETLDTGFVSFWLDDQRLASTKIAAIGRAAKTQISVYGQAKVGSSYTLAVEEVRIYARRPDLAPTPPK